MKLSIERLQDGQYQVDFTDEHGLDFHARGRSAGVALMDIGLFIEESKRPADSDMLMLGNVLRGERP